MKTTLWGLVGTLATVSTETAARVDHFAAWVPAGLTSLWILRQLYLSFKPRRK